MRTVWLLIFSLITFSGFTQNFHLSHYTESDGLPSDKVYHVALDSFGFIWIATRQGLTRFDGSNFRSFAQDVPSQHGKYLFPSEDGLLLSHDAGISLITPGVDSVKIRMYKDASINPEDSALYYPGQMLRDQSGTLWISQNNGLITSFKNGQSKDYRDQKKTVSTYFAEHPSGRLYAVSNLGEVLFYDKTSDTFKTITKVPSANTILIHDNQLWIGGQFLHQLILNKEGDKLSRQIVYRDLPAAVTTLAIGPSQELLAGIKGLGLLQLQVKSNRVLEQRPLFSNNDPNRIDELPFKNVHQIVLLNERQLFICSDEGFGILQNRFFESVNGLPNGNTSTIAASGSNQVYVNFGDLYRIKSDDGIFRATPLPNNRFGNISSIVLQDQHLWVGTATGNLIKSNKDATPLKVLDFTDRGEGIFYLLPDTKNRLWVCQAPSSKPISALGCLIPNGQFKEYDKANGLENRVLVVKESPQGRLYAGGIGKQSYLYRYLPEEDVFLNISLPFDFYINPNFEVHDITIDDQGIIWLATTDGLLRYDLDRVELIPLSKSNPSIEIRAVQHMPNGNIWCSTDTEGLILYDQNQSIAIKEESGLPSKVMAYRALIRDENDRLWVGTAEGLVYSFNTNPKPKLSHQPILVGMEIDGKPVGRNQFELFQDESLVIRLNSPAYHGYRTFYQYQIDSSAWSPLNTVSAFNFEQLPLGNYSIAVRAKQEGSNYPSEALIIPLKVQLRWYQQPWLRWGFSLGIVLPLFLLWLYRRKKYTEVIANLSKEINLNKARIKLRDRALAKAKAEIDQDHRELRVTMLSLNLLGSIIHKVAPGTKWDDVLEELSIDLLRLPGVIAFEVAHLENRHLHFEGYSDLVKGFTSARIPNDANTNLAAYVISLNKPIIFNNLRNAEADYLTKITKGKNAHKIQAYQSALMAPFDWRKYPALLILYSDKEGFFDRYNLKTIVVLANYLEQITKA
jgi:ligand-binding sensor domain-containing protein